MRSTLRTTLLAVCALPLVVVATRAQNPVSNGIRGLAQRQTGVIGRDGDDHLDALAAVAAASYASAIRR